MDSCKHRRLLLLKLETKRLRCRRCHLTIKENELAGGYCPECYEERGSRHSDFETITVADKGEASYRCEDCNALIGAGD